MAGVEREELQRRGTVIVGAFQTWLFSTMIIVTDEAFTIYSVNLFELFPRWSHFSGVGRCTTITVFIILMSTVQIKKTDFKGCLIRLQVEALQLPSSTTVTCHPRANFIEVPSRVVCIPAQMHKHVKTNFIILKHLTNCSKTFSRYFSQKFIPFH